MTQLIKTLFFIVIALSKSLGLYGQNDLSNPDKYLENVFLQKLELCDSLISQRMFGPARFLLNNPFMKYYPYTKSNEEEYLSRFYLIDSLARFQTHEDRVNENLYSGRQSESEYRFQDAIYWYQRSGLEGLNQIEKINSLPTDTAYSSSGLFNLPFRVGYLPFSLHYGASRKPQSDTSSLYLIRDTSLYSGVLVFKENHFQSRRYSGYFMKFHTYLNGQHINEKTYDYRLNTFASKLVSRNPTYQASKSQHYLYSIEYKLNDTLFVKRYHENGNSAGHSKSFLTRPYSIRESVTYDLNGRTIDYLNYENTKGFVSSLSYKINESNDTLHYKSWVGTDSINNAFEMKRNENLDTLKYYKKINNQLDGIQYRDFYEGYDLVSFKILWDRGKMIDLMASNLILVNKKGELIDKTNFIKQANDKEINLWNAELVRYTNNNTSNTAIFCYLIDSQLNKNRSKVDKNLRCVLKHKKRIIKKWMKQKNKSN